MVITIKLNGNYLINITMKMKYDKLYVKFKRPKTIKQFLTKFYSEVLHVKYRFPIQTYFDKACTKMQCRKHTYRSIDDLFILVKTYYPSATLKKLMKILVQLDLSTKDKQIRMIIGSCSGIDNIRIYFGPGTVNHYSLTHIRKHSATHSWVELFKMIGVNNKEEYDALYKKVLNGDAI
tara:strand:- start:106 stop:639 length:534 start_codon:yes stop_codon:yes gene_type:complete